MSSHHHKASGKREKDGNPSTSYTCYICDTEVPSAFSEAHNASRRHSANASIMAAASERMRAMVTAHPPPRTPRPDGTYCAICNTIADSDHKKTAKHKQAVRDEQLLSMLANLYCGGGGDNDDDDNDSADEISKSQDNTDKNDSCDAKVNKATKVANQIDFERAAEDDDDDSPIEISKSQDNTDNNKDSSDVQVIKATKVANQIDFERAAESNDENSPSEISKSQDNTDNNKDPSDVKVIKATKVANQKDVERAEEDDDFDSPIEISKRQDDTDMNKGPLDAKVNKATKVANQIDVTRAAEDDADDSPNEISKSPDDMDKNNANNNTKGNVNAIKTDQQTKFVDNNKIKQASGVVSDIYDPEHNFFWALVKRFKIEQPRHTRFITILPAGSKIQIHVEGEKLNVPYDSFHSFNRYEGKCLLCMGYFDTHFASEDHHIMSNKHMKRIMLPVNDAHCFRKIAEWFHCIICNDTYHILCEEEHKMSPEHRKNKIEATVRRDQKPRTQLPKNPTTTNVYEPSQNANAPVQHLSSKNAETESRRKITLQKQMA